MIGSSRSYAIGMAHFQIAGGLRSLLLLCAAYVAVVAIIASWFYYKTVGPASGPVFVGPVFTSMAVTLILLMQTFSLLFFGTFRIMGAVRLDMTNKMIESHRLMPIPSWRAVAGYMFGSTTHAIAFALLNVLLAYIFAGISRTSFAQVTMSESVLALFVLLAWSAAVLGSFRGRSYGVIVAMSISGGFAGGIYIYSLLPGLALLISPLMGETVFHFSARPATLSLAYPVSFAAQAVFFSIFFAGACRLYRGTYASTFNLAQALAISLAWTLTSIAGIRLWDTFHVDLRMFFRDMASISSNHQTIASIIAAMLVAIVPLRTLVFTERRWKKNQPLASAATLLAIIAIITSIPLAIIHHAEATPANLTITALVVASHVFCVYLLLRVMRRAKPTQAIMAVAIPGILLWIGPLAVELIQTLLAVPDAYGNRHSGTGFASSFSPPGLLTETWLPGPHVSPLPGLIFLCLVPALLTLLVFKKRLAPPALAEPATPPLFNHPTPPSPLTTDPPESPSP